MENLIIKLKETLSECKGGVNGFDKKGVDNLDYSETEDYGFFLGKVELLEDIIPKLEAFCK